MRQRERRLETVYMTVASRRAALAYLAAGAVTAHVPLAWASDAWPTKPVRIVVPFAPGGGADTSARVLAELIAPQLGQSIIVENKPGAGSAIGVVAAAQSKDGHTLLMGSNSMVINPSLNAHVGYDVSRDFDVIGMVRRNRSCWSFRATRTSSRFQTWSRKPKPSPGRCPLETAATARSRTSRPRCSQAWPASTPRPCHTGARALSCRT